MYSISSNHTLVFFTFSHPLRDCRRQSHGALAIGMQHSPAGVSGLLYLLFAGLLVPTTAQVSKSVVTQIKLGRAITSHRTGRSQLIPPFLSSCQPSSCPSDKTTNPTERHPRPNIFSCPSDRPLDIDSR